MLKDSLQGFPDAFCLVGSKKGSTGHVNSRYQQIVNAVSPLVAESLGTITI